MLILVTGISSLSWNNISLSIIYLSILELHNQTPCLANSPIVGIFLVNRFREPDFLTSSNSPLGIMLFGIPSQNTWSLPCFFCSYPFIFIYDTVGWDVLRVYELLPGRGRYREMCVMGGVWSMCYWGLWKQSDQIYCVLYTNTTHFSICILYLRRDQCRVRMTDHSVPDIIYWLATAPRGWSVYHTLNSVNGLLSQSRLVIVKTIIVNLYNFIHLLLKYCLNKLLA